MMVSAHMWSHTLNYIQSLLKYVFNACRNISTQIIKPHSLWGVYLVSPLLGPNHTKSCGDIHREWLLFMLNWPGGPSNVWRDYFYMLWSQALLAGQSWGIIYSRIKLWHLHIYTSLINLEISTLCVDLALYQDLQHQLIICETTVRYSTSVL